MNLAVNKVRLLNASKSPASTNYYGFQVMYEDNLAGGSVGGNVAVHGVSVATNPGTITGAAGNIIGVVGNAVANGAGNLTGAGSGIFGVVGNSGIDSASVITVDSVMCFSCNVFVNDFLSSASTITTAIGYNVFATGSQAPGIIVNLHGLFIGDQTGGTTINNAITTGLGKLSFGDKISKYNAITTVGNGVPAEYATVDLTTQSAAIAATTIYTPTASGLFRLSIFLKVTQAATTSSTLGGAAGVVITYTDATDSVAQSVTALLGKQDGTSGISNAGNTTTTVLQGSMILNAKTGVAIQHAVGYTSSGATVMQYEVHYKLEAL